MSKTKTQGHPEKDVLIEGKIPSYLTKVRTKLARCRKRNNLTFTMTHLNPKYQGQGHNKFHTYLVLTGVDAQDEKMLALAKRLLGVDPNIKPNNPYRTSFSVRHLYIKE